MTGRLALALCLLIGGCTPAVAITPEGIVYESEAIAQPTSAWIKDRGTPDHWNLWTKEDQIERKRSGGAVLASPAVKADRQKPEEGAPPLHCTVRDLKPGWYHAFVSPPGRPLGYSLDGKEWFPHQGGELDLGLFQAGERPFELWVDDRYAAPPGKPGPGYFDYVRFVPTADPRIENLEARSPEPGVVEVCWTTSVPLAGGQVLLAAAGKQQRSPAEPLPLRNHRVVVRGLDPTQTASVQVIYQSRLGGLVSETRTLRATPQPPSTRNDLSIPLSVVEPSGHLRKQWPTVIGVPFAQGSLADANELTLISSAGRAAALQAETFSRWSDGSVKWAWLSFLADTARESTPGYRLIATSRTLSGEAVVSLKATADDWVIQSPAVSLRVDRRRGDLFSDLSSKPGAAQTHAPATAKLANLRLVDGAGKTWVCGPPGDEGPIIECNGPVRAVVKWSGPLVLADGAASQSEWGYLVRLTFWRGSPLLEVDVSLWRDALEPAFAEVRAWTLRVPLPGTDGDSSDNAKPLDWAIQDHDNRCRFADATNLPAGGQKERGEGFVHAAGPAGEMAVGLPDFWQNYPYGYRADSAGIDLLLLPELPAEIYRDADGRQWYWRIHSWCRDGKYVFRSGQTLRRRAVVWLGPCENGPALSAWLQQPLLPQAPPECLCASGILGSRLSPQSAGHWKDYEEWFARSFAQLEKNGRENRSFGFMHYGDWYGERGLNYGNNEYDLPWALTVQWMRSGNAEYFWRGLAMARHYSSIDSIRGRPAEQARGLCREHSFNHVGTPATPEELFLPVGKGRAKEYLDLYGKGMFRGAVDPQGHIFQEGNWISAAVSGDAFLRDEAARVCDHQAAQLTRKFDFTIERSGGWPLINAVGAYRHSGDPYYLNAARIMIERCLARQDAATGGWLHQPPLSETDGQKVLGGKAFAVGILSFGILRYTEVEPRDRPEVRQMLIRGADWLMNEAWNPEKKGFRYISNCAKYRDTGSRGLTALMTLELAAAAYQWTRDDKYRRFARELLEDAFTGDCGSMGKSFAQGTRQTIFGLDRLRQAELELWTPGTAR